jgi:Ca-activated chloride channel family protein
MRWQNPDAFWTLVCLIPLSMLLIWAFAKRLQSLHLFAQKALWKRLLPQYNPLRRAVKLFLILCAFVALLIALARPQFGFRDEEIEMTGLDVMLVLDVSLSMDAQDVIPSRIAKAKHWLKRFVNSLASDRVGLILFAQSSFVDCPLTPDLNYVRARIEAANTGSVQVQGTNIGNGLKTALFALQKGAEQEIGAQKNLSHVVLLLSDGEDHDSQALAQAKEFQEKGIKLIVVGIGTPEGGKIPLQDATGNTVFLKDAKGKVVTTKFDKTFLNKLAETAGSQYFDLTESGNAALLQITQDLGLLGGSDNKIHKTIRVYNERFQVPVGIGLGLLLFEFAIGLLPLGLFRRVFKNKKALALFWLSLAVPMNAAFATSAQAPPLQAAPEAAPPPPQPTRAKTIKTYRLNRRGLQELQAQQFEDALQDFGEAQVDDPDVEELDFNQGLAMAGANQHTEAIKKFEKTRESHNPRMQLESQYELGHVYAARKSYNQAVIEYAKALALAKLYNQPDL